MSLELPFLSQEDVVAAGGADMRAAVVDVEEALALHADGDTLVPSKTVLRWGGVETEYTRGRINSMPSYLGGRFDVAGIKWISGFPRNPARHGLPRAAGLLVLNDPDTGMPLAILDGTVISATRTGAMTGVAAKHLARPDSEVAGIIGSGVQGRTQAQALAAVLPRLRTILAYDIDRERLERFAADVAADVGLEVVPVGSAAEAAEPAEALVTATVAKEPIVKAGWLRPGDFYAAVGGHEFEFEVARRASKIVVDSWEEVKHRGTQTLYFMFQEREIGDEDIHAELGELALGRKQGRTDPDELTLFCSIGMGIADLAVAGRVVRRARDEGIGTELTLWREPFAV